MANTFGTPVVNRAKSGRQFQALFSDIWTVKIPVTDQDAIADDVSVDITATITGVALGDLVFCVGATKAQQDANAGVTIHAWVSAADQITVRFVNVDATTDAYDADTLTDGFIKCIVARPAW